MKPVYLLVGLTIVALGLWCVLLQPASGAAEVHTPKPSDSSPVVVAAADEARAQIERILMSDAPQAVAPSPEHISAPSDGASSLDKPEPSVLTGQVSLTDYDFVATVVNTPRFVDADEMHYSRQLNPRGTSVPAWVVKAVADDVAEAKRKTIRLTNQLGSVRGVEMSDLRKSGGLKKLDRSLAPQVYDEAVTYARLAYRQENAEKVKANGWEETPEFRLFVNQRIVGAFAAKTRYTQALFSGDGNVYVAGVSDLPKFHHLLQDGALQIVAADLCMRVLDHYRVAGMLTEQEREALWARFTTLLGNMMEKLSR